MSTKSKEGESKQTEIPEDLEKTTDIQNDSDTNSSINLFDYFVSNDRDQIIKKWGHLYQKDKDKAFCELISLIFQLAGHKIEITPAHFESIAGEALLEEYNDASENAPSFKPPITSFSKNISKLLPEFWNFISKQIISTQAIFTKQALSYRNWITILSESHPRYIRTIAVQCASSLFLALTESISTKSEELCRLQKKSDQSDIIKSKIESLTNENRFYLSSANNLYNAILVKSLRDVDPQVRIVSLDSLVDGAIQCPNPFSDETHLSQLAICVRDKVTKDRQNALKSILRLIENTPSENWKHLCERIEENLIDLCDDKDNKTVETSLMILKKMSENNCLHSSDEELENCSFLLADATPSVRIAAQKFVVSRFFDQSKSDDEQLTHLIDFTKRFTKDELQSVIGVLYSVIGVLKKFDVICQKLLTIDEERSQRLSMILLFSAQAASGKIENIPIEENTEILENLSVTFVSKLSQLILAYQSDPHTQIYLIQCASLIDLDCVSEFSVDRMFPDLLTNIRESFISSDDPNLFNCASSVLYELSVGHHQLNQIARTELDRLAVCCGEVNGSKSVNISKFLSAARFVNMSDNDKIRNVLFDGVNDENSDICQNSIEALDLFFQWDVLKLKEKPELVDDYKEMYLKIFETFSLKLESNDTNIKLKSMKAISNLFCLQNIIKSDYCHIEDSFIRNYCRVWHSLKFSRNNDLFNHLVRPFLWGIFPRKYLSHFIIYIGDETVRDSCSLCCNELKKSGILNGSEVPFSIIYMKENNYPDTMIQTGVRFLCRKFNKFDVLNYFKDHDESDEFDDEVLYFIRSLSQDEATKYLPYSGKLRNQVEKVSKGQKPTIFKKKVPKKETDDLYHDELVVLERDS
ncbi:hypothetical protein TVAG_111490 [Trichomonas vaginalis G3]|uniref:SCD domain-containing protein n=1 Tax=Trichomonas vaginalis (strain ATCC PRA-98 / G3) TaxID=412133 RepID=A2F008_TRIV3|nr:SCC3-like chromosomal segregation protein A [Trichomonas vaginalis G3]EAY01792.1 hypothetical protein TVAG_111490 [Trichomonas vaginalis G3]KAI5546826.1 SCC3-like chromosomal segregation protein A [Trichomonas vaginalis G3]|eukprot:XP_001330418.1 hypothetical protein [Trichomonas vaginalis G3]